MWEKFCGLAGAGPCLKLRYRNAGVVSCVPAFVSIGHRNGVDRNFSCAGQVASAVDFEPTS